MVKDSCPKSVVAVCGPSGCDQQTKLQRRYHPTNARQRQQNKVIHTFVLMIYQSTWPDIKCTLIDKSMQESGGKYWPGSPSSSFPNNCQSLGRTRHLQQHFIVDYVAIGWIRHQTKIYMEQIKYNKDREHIEKTKNTENPNAKIS